MFKNNDIEYDIHKMVEIYMLITNQYAGEILYKNNSDSLK